jgi:hypothetical protein
MEQILRPLIGCGSFLVALAVGMQWFRVRYKLDTQRRPVSDRLLRSPGESLQKKRNELNEKLMGLCLVAAMLPVLGATAVPNPTYPVSLAIILTLAAVGLIPVFKTLKVWRAYDLGLSGERAVGEELNQLMLEGYHVFHDYPAGPNWNIDHIVIGRSGVYAIETKTRRKKKPRDGGDDHKIIFDGKVLHFPCETSTCGLKQAQDNANGLADQLSKALAEPIQVQPILTFPGWFITRTGKNGVLVVNAKEIRRCIVSSDRPQLSPKQIEQIAFRIEEKCRDVEF